MALKFSGARYSSAALVAIASVASAQDNSATAASAPPAGTGASSGVQLEEELENVTITGTRIVRDGYAAPTPVTVATVDSTPLFDPENSRVRS